jgi:thiol peroxidase
MSAEAPKITMKGDPMTLTGPVPAVGDPLPDAPLVATDLTPTKLSELRGKVVVLAAVPSLDTGVCDTEAQRFNKEAGQLGDDVEVVVVSRDLPFAQKRWCGQTDANNIRTFSDYREGEFGEASGLMIVELKLLARAVLVADKQGKVTYVEIVSEVTDEPDYDAALAAAKAAAE